MKTNRHIELSDRKAITLCLIYAAVIFMLDSLIPLGVAGGVPYILVVLISLWAPRKRLIWEVAIITSMLTLLGFFSSPAGGELWKVLFNRFIAVFAIWTTAALSMQRRIIQDEKERVASEIKELSAMLPICCMCKKIRDDKGYWSQVETYINKHTGTAFSHGYCPECENKVLAEIKEDGLKKVNSLAK